MIIGFLGVANVYFFLTGLFRMASPPEDASVEAVGEKRYNRVIYLLLDALRMDSSIRTSKRGHIYNKMDYLYSIKNKFHALSVSGVPTETGARVLGMATGMPGNFLTSALTLQGSSVRVDNMVRQLARNGSIAFFGDHEWIDFFPELRDHPHHTMDPYGKCEPRKKEDFTIERLLEGVNRYDAIVAHLINLDSYGHVYGTEHQMMEKELRIYDNLIREIYEKMSKDTLLVICSDHGVDNDGAHGGLSTLEMSSVGIFASKDCRFVDVAAIGPETAALRRNHVSRFYQENPDEIMGEEPYVLIHQDDILPTMCYLMGLPIPKTSSGNFIHEIVRDEAAYKTFARQKSEVLGIPFDGSLGSLEHYVALNYELSKKMFSRFAGRSSARLAVSAVISAAMAALIAAKLFRIRSSRISYLALSIVMIMMAHSVFSIMHEDLFWSLLFLASNQSLQNALGVLLLLQMARPPSGSNPLYATVAGRLKLSPIFNGNLVFVLEICLFAFINSMEHLEWDFLFPLRSILRMMDSHPQILISLLKYFFHQEMSSPALRVTLLASVPSLDTLLSLMFRPMESIYLIYISRNLEARNNLHTYFSMTNMAVFSSGLQKLLQSINYDVFFTFSDSFFPLAAAAMSLCYLVYPRIRAVSRFRMGQTKNSLLSAEEVSAFMGFNLLLVMWSGYAICDSLSFYRFLANRTFFECLYYLSDILLMALRGIAKTFRQRSKAGV